MDKTKILFVDDEMDFLETMGRVIESWEYEVIPANNASEAMEALSERKPDIIILDYIMPNINGIELLKKIRAVNKKIPVIMFTVKPESKVIDESLRLNISAFIPKLSTFADTQKNLKTSLEMIVKKMGKQP